MKGPLKIEEQGLNLQQFLRWQHACNTHFMSCHAMLLEISVKRACLQRGAWQTCIIPFQVWKPFCARYAGMDALSLCFLMAGDSAVSGHLAPVL